jgi:YVTN family beta-propeller protein
MSPPATSRSRLPWRKSCATLALGSAACLLPLPGCSASSAATSSADVGLAGPPGKIYVTMYGDDEITVIDQATRTVVAHIPVGKGPAILLSTPDKKKLYTANWLDNSISAVDVATHAVKSIPMGSRPWAVAMSPDGASVYAGLGANRIAVVSTATDAVARSIDTSPDLPESVAVSADGTTLYVAPTSTGGTTALGPGSLEALSTTTGAVVHAPITVGSAPAWASVSPDGSRAYTLDFVSGDVSVVDTAAWRVTATVAVGSGSQPIISASTPGGTLAVTNFGTGNLVTIDAAGKVTHTLALDGRPVGVGGFDRGGTLGYACDFGHASLAVAESLPALTAFLAGDLTTFVGKGPGHVTAFDPATGAQVGKAITVGKGPTSVVVIAP